MKKLILLKSILLVLILVQLEMEAHAAEPREELLFTSKLEGTQLVPELMTDAAGIGTFMLNDKRDSLSINVSIVGASSISAGIYMGSAGTVGTLVKDLSDDLLGNRITTVLTGSELNDNISNFIKGELYLLVASNENPMGELRGQILLNSDMSIVASLSANEAIPPNFSGAYGLGSFDLSLDRKVLNFKLICQNLIGDITDVTLNIGSLGDVGAVLESLDAFIDGNTVIGSIEASICKCNYYKLYGWGDSFSASDE